MRLLAAFDHHTAASLYRVLTIRPDLAGLSQSQDPDRERKVSPMLIRPNLAGLVGRATYPFVVAACAAALAGCAAAPRVSYTQQEQSAATIPGMPVARIWQMTRRSRRDGARS
jgi:hypothetical protein